MKFSYPEGATPLDDTSDLKLSWVQTQEDLNHVEGENIAKAASKYLLKTVNKPTDWFNVPFLQKIHYDMFSDVWGWAGKFRTTQTCPGIKPYQIHQALLHLSEDVKFWFDEKSGLAPIEQAVQIHHRLVLIHPYANGNGRFSRLVSDRYLKFFKYPIPNWPIDLNKDGQERKKYINALREADAGHYEPLVLYIKKLLE